MENLETIEEYKPFLLEQLYLWVLENNGIPILRISVPDEILEQNPESIPSELVETLNGKKYIDINLKNVSNLEFIDTINFDLLTLHLQDDYIYESIYFSIPISYIMMMFDNITNFVIYNDYELERSKIITDSIINKLITDMKNG